MMELTNKLGLNYLFGLKSKSINPIDRAMIIHKICVDENLSLRALAKKLEMPHSTIQDWAMWNRLTSDDYKSMINKGFNETDIYRLLRENKKEKTDVILSKTNSTYRLDKAIELLKPLSTTLKDEEGVLERVHELRNIINKIVLKVDRFR